MDNVQFSLSCCLRMLVGAPWDGPPDNRKGDVYKCIVGEEKKSNCSKVHLGEKNKNPQENQILPEKKNITSSLDM